MCFPTLACSYSGSQLRKGKSICPGRYQTRGPIQFIANKKSQWSCALAPAAVPWRRFYFRLARRAKERTHPELQRSQRCWMVPHLSLGTAGVPRLTAKKAKPLAASADDRRRITRRAQGHVPERVSCARAQRRAMNPEPSANPRLAAAKLVADETCVAGVMHACMHACLPAWMHAGRQAGRWVCHVHVCVYGYVLYV